MGWLSNNVMYMEFEDNASGKDFGGFDTWDIWTLEFKFDQIFFTTNNENARGCSCASLGAPTKTRLICCVQTIEMCKAVFQYIIK